MGQQILDVAIQAYGNRKGEKVHIPDVKHETLVGFSLEMITGALSKLDPEDPLNPLVNAIASGDIKGVVLFVGCSNYKVPQDANFLTMAKQLAIENVLVLATGCAAGAFAKQGLLSPSSTETLCGESLKGTLTAIGEAAGLGRPLPPVLHMGSCVDNARPLRLLYALANKLGVDLDQLPVIASAPEPMSEKAIAIGTGAVALGVTVHLGLSPPVLGGKIVTKILTETTKDVLGSHFFVEPDPVVASSKIVEMIAEKRVKLGLGR